MMQHLAHVDLDEQYDSGLGGAVLSLPAILEVALCVLDDLPPFIILRQLRPCRRDCNLLQRALLVASICISQW